MKHKISTMMFVCLSAGLVALSSFAYGQKTDSPTSREPHGKGPRQVARTQPAEQTAVLQARGMRTVERLDAGEAPGRIPIIYNDRSPSQGSAAAGVATAYVFKNDYDSGYGLFLNYLPDTGAYFPGTMMADEMILGNGFVPGGTISGYEVGIVRDAADPLNAGTLATYHMELWDGDPLGMIDTAGGGYSGSVIAGTQATFTDVPGPGVYVLHADLDPPVVIPNQRVWIVIYGEDTCRTGWIISGFTPEVGSIFTGINDMYESQEDYDASITGNGDCCDGTPGPCAWGTPDECPGESSSSPLGYCTDLDAESAFLSYFGGPCEGNPATDFCASFYANAVAETDTYLGVMPVSSSDPGAVLDGHTITLEDCTDTVIEFEIKVAGWDPDLNGTPRLKTWEANIDASAFAFDLTGYVTYYLHPCTTWADCIEAFGGACSLFGNSCTSDSDCSTMLGEVCQGASCDYPPGVGVYCCPCFQLFGRTDAVLSKYPIDPYFCTLPCRFGTTMAPSGTPWTDAGIVYYGGTMEMVTSQDVAGTALVLLDAGRSFMKDGNNQPIPLVGLRNASVVCPTGQCCDMEEGDPQLRCVADTVSQEQCDGLVGSAYLWSSERTCHDPCCDCASPNGTPDPTCGDGDACTVDRCVVCLCEHTPVSIGPDECCDPTTIMGTWDDINGGGTITGNDDGNLCTLDLCDAPGSCALGEQCGAPAHAPAEEGMPCADSPPCFMRQCLSGVCTAPVDITGLPCESNDDCFASQNPSTYCNLDISTCICGAAASVKNRYLSLIPSDNPGQQTALRVTLVSLPHPFEGYNGCQLWVSEPRDVSERSGQNDGTTPTFNDAELQAVPHCMDWSTVGLLHVGDNEIVPGAFYEIEVVDCGFGFSNKLGSVTPLITSTSIWGDLVDTFGYWLPPDGAMNLYDVSAAVDKFVNRPGAPIKARVDVEPDTPNRIIDFGDISRLVDAFRGASYPFSGPDECP